MAIGRENSLLGVLSRAFEDDPLTREQQTRGILDAYRQEPAIPQGGIDPQAYQQGQQYQPRAQTDQAGLLNSLLGAGNNQQEAMGMMGMMNPQQAQMLDPVAQLEAVNKLRSPYTKAMASPRKSIYNYNDAVDIVGNSQFKNNMLSGAESVALVKKYLKQVLPDESVMGDDIQTLLSSQGVSEQYKSVVNRFLGDSGTVSREGAQEIMRTMATMASSGGAERDLLRTQFTDEAGQYQLPTTFMGARADIKQNPLSKAAWMKSKGY